MKKIYNVKIEPLTAVHIGTGDTLTPLDYKVHEIKTKGRTRRIYAKFSSDAMLARLIESGKKDALRQFEVASNSGDMKQLHQFFQGNFELDDLEYPCDLTREFLSLYTEKQGGNPVDNALEVLQMYRPAGAKTPVLPGSSIKGSIRTALLNQQMANMEDKDYDSYLEKIEDIDEIPSQKERNAKHMRQEQPLQKKLFSYNDAKNDPLRTLAIADTSFSAKGTQAVGVLRTSAVDKRFNELEFVDIQILAEFLKGTLLGGETLGEGKIIFDEGLQKERAARIAKAIAMKDIVSACNYFYKREFDTEYEQFYKPCSEHLDVVVELKKQIEAVAEQKNQFLLRLGRWSQVEFVTFEENFCRPKTPVRKGKQQGYGGTRTLLDYNGNYVPMGWCKCTVENL